MVRRTLAALLLGPALFAASLAWSGFIAQRTVLDAGRSQQIAADLYDDSEVRSQLAASTAEVLASLLPEGVSASSAQMEAVADRVMGDPRVRVLVVDSFADAHGAFLGEAELPRTLDLAPAGEAITEAFLAIRPDLAGALPEAPSVAIPLPTEHIPDASPVKAFVRTAVPILLAAALIGVGLALAATNRRSSVMRRAGLWAISAAGFILVVAIALPWGARKVIPGQAQVLGAIIEALFSATLRPAVVLGSAGAGLLVSSAVWSTKERLGHDGNRRPKEAEQVATMAMAPASESRETHQHTRHEGPERFPLWKADSGVAVQAPEPTINDAPTIMVAVATAEPSPAPKPTGSVPGAPSAPTPAPNWREGVGWIQHPDDSRSHPGARWEPGIGYVLPEVPDPSDQ